TETPSPFSNVRREIRRFLLIAPPRNYLEEIHESARIPTNLHEYDQNELIIGPGFRPAYSIFLHSYSWRFVEIRVDSWISSPPLALLEGVALHDPQHQAGEAVIVPRHLGADVVHR